MDKEILEKLIEEKYITLRSMRKITRELKVGIKTVRKVLTKKGYTVSNYERTVNTPIKVGDKFGRWTVLSINIKDKSDNNRYKVLVQCECGNTSLVRPSFLITGKAFGCKHCVNKVNYPTFRKSRRNIDPSLKGLSSIWLSSIKNYSKRGLYRTLPIEITLNDLLDQLELQNFKCPYTGIVLNVLHLSKEESNASVDRIDSQKGYTKDNIQWVYKKINRMKNSMPEGEFLDICKQIYVFKYDNFEPS